MRHNKYFALAKKRIRKEKTFLRGHNLTWETQRYTYLLKSKQTLNLVFDYVFFQKYFLPWFNVVLTQGFIFLNFFTESAPRLIQSKRSSVHMLYVVPSWKPRFAVT